MERVLKHEDQMLEEHKIPVLRVVNDTEDIEESRKEEEVASGRSKDGTSRVRTDEVMLREPELRRGNRPKKRRRVACETTSTIDKEYDQENGNNSPKFGPVLLNEADSIDENVTDCMPPSITWGIFDASSVVLSSPDLVKGEQTNNAQPLAVRTVSIAASLANELKAHQIEGVEFMWKNCFCDLSFVDPSEHVIESVGGCILAHVSGATMLFVFASFSLLCSSQFFVLSINKILLLL